jgi:hypothetical protein
MNESLLGIRQRRGELLARIEIQRGQLADLASGWEAPLALADQGIAVVRFLRRHTVLFAGLVALVVVRRQGAAGLFQRAWLAWKSLRHFAHLWKGL